VMSDIFIGLSCWGGSAVNETFAVIGS